MTARTFRRTAALALSLTVAAGALFASHQASAADALVRINPLIEKLQGTGSSLTPDDWAFLDNEHQPYMMDKLVENLAAMGKHRKANGQLMSAPIVRIPADGDEDARWMVKQILDSGAVGIVFGHVESRAQAERAVSNMRYPPQKGEMHPKPLGVRGFGPFRAAQYWGLPVDQYIKRADVWPLNPNGELTAFVQIESVEGVKHVEEIASTPGIAGILLGPSDLGMSLGVGPAQPKVPPETEKAVQIVLAACKKNNIACIYPATSGDAEVKMRVDQGFKMILTGKMMNE